MSKPANPSAPDAAGAPRDGIYIHVPFCEAKCTYCHFAIDPRKPGEERQERYVRAVLAEMEGTEAAADTLYFGGGTPSLLQLERLSRIVEVARRRFALPSGAEVTVEANPRDLDEGGFRTLRTLGATRLSLGVQSLDDSVLREMGRLHTGGDARRSVEAVRRAGFANLSLDLILGWPGETAERWGRTLDGCLALAPDHVSLYVLEVEGRTVVSHRQRQGRLDLPEDDLVADLYQDTVGRLAARGLERYEISNFARPGFESRHNGKYWDDAPFLGFGMAAHSYRHGRRSWNHDRFATYCRAVEEGGPAAAVAGERVLSPRDRAAEALFTGLRRREGVALGAFRTRYGLEPLDEWAEGLARASTAGLVEERDGRLRLTDRGVLLSNEVFRAFV
ncbi:MAG TPA: radical SAM family heme chaperone HemW [Vicinamibacteria bacterium]|nr:radical SAM family heme chaperone HemW [Vicinamibacteria bacterium]